MIFHNPEKITTSEFKIELNIVVTSVPKELTDSFWTLVISLFTLFDY